MTEDEVLVDLVSYCPELCGATSGDEDSDAVLQKMGENRARDGAGRGISTGHHDNPPIPPGT